MPMNSFSPMSNTKEIVAEIPGYLKVLSDGSVERAIAGKDEVDNPIAPVPASQTFVDGVATRDVQIDPQTGAWVRIYFPEIITTTAENEDFSGVTRRPLVVHFHGGGFCIGSPDWRMFYDFYAPLVKQCGVVCVSLKYRLAPEHRLPAACEDCWRCLLWIRSVARREREDPWLTHYADFGRCYLMGESAGANLVHQVAIRAGTENLHPVYVRGGILINPGFAREQPSRSEMETPEDPSLSKEMADVTKLVLPEGATRNHPIINPMDTDLQPVKLPSVLVAISEGDMFRDTQFEYCEAMKAAGKSVEIVRYEKLGHCFHVNCPLLRTDPNASIQTAHLMNAVNAFIKTNGGASEVINVQFCMLLRNGQDGGQGCCNFE